MRYDAIWEYGFLEELIGRDKVILQKDFEDILNSGTVSINRTGWDGRPALVASGKDAMG